MGQERITTEAVRFEDYLYPAFHYSTIPLFRSLLLSSVLCHLSSDRLSMPYALCVPVLRGPVLLV